MKRKASIISNSLNLDKLIQSFDKSNRYVLINVWNESIDLEKLIEIDSVFIDTSVNRNILAKIERFCLDNNIELSTFTNSINIRKPKIKAIDDLCFISLNSYKISKLNSLLKRAFDIVFSLIFIIVSLPIFIILILLIKIIDGGPVFYFQKRLTMDKKEFVIIKFRTMKVNAEKETGAVLSHATDDRLTNIGRFLRKSSLDEIPQIFNVLCGDMSIVGPRPERSHFIKKYNRINEYYKYRFNVKAGITGYAQVYAKYDSSYRDKLDFDLYYISNYSILKDLKIIFKTIIHVLSKNIGSKINKDKITVKDDGLWENQVGKN